MSSSPDRGGNWDAAYLIYGTTTAGWSTAQNQASNQYVIVELMNGQSYLVDRVRINPAATGGDAANNDLKRFEIRISNTDATYNSFTTVLSDQTPKQNQFFEFTFPAAQARYVMLYGKTNWNGAYLEAAELEVYQAPPATATPTATGGPTDAWVYSYDPAHPHAVSAADDPYGSTSYSYDLNGNMTSGGGRTSQAVSGTMGTASWQRRPRMG